jgi:hypothetical protein
MVHLLPCQNGIKDIYPTTYDSSISHHKCINGVVAYVLRHYQWSLVIWTVFILLLIVTCSCSVGTFDRSYLSP